MRLFLVGLSDGFARSLARYVSSDPRVALTGVAPSLAIAEGVETSEQAQRLAALGCDEAQGYHYSRPVPAAQIEALMRSGGTLPALPSA